MVDVTVPVQTTKQLVRTQRSITAANTSSGDAILYGAATSLVLLKNNESAGWQFDMQYQVGGGAWVSLPIRTIAPLDIDLATQTLRVRKASPYAPATLTLDLEILTAPTGLFTEPSDTLGGLTAAQAAAVALRVYKGASTEAAPLSGFITPTGAQVLSGNEPWLIPANSMAVGSYIDVGLDLLRTGSAANATFELRFGPANNTSSGILISRAFATTSARPTLQGRITVVDATTVQFRGRTFFATGGINVDQPQGTVGTPTANAGTVTGLNLAVDNWLVLSLNSVTSPDAGALQNYQILPFR